MSEQAQEVKKLESRNITMFLTRLTTAMEWELCETPNIEPTAEDIIESEE